MVCDDHFPKAAKMAFRCARKGAQSVSFWQSPEILIGSDLSLLAVAFAGHVRIDSG
jgi:hypothetical protein